MKKYLSIMLSLAMLTGLGGCGGDSSSAPSTPLAPDDITTTTVNGGGVITKPTASAETGDTMTIDPTETTGISETCTNPSVKPTGNTIGKTTKTIATKVTNPVVRPTGKPLVDGPASSTLAAYDMTASRIKDSSVWDTEVASYYDVKLHKNGVLQIGNGSTTQREAFAACIDKDGMFNKLVSMDIMFYSPGELALTEAGTHAVQGKGYILFRASKVSDMGKRNPSYVLEYEDCGNFKFRVLKYDSQGETTVARTVSVERFYKPYEYNYLQVGFFNEDGGVRILVYLNGSLVINELDKNPSAELKKAGYMVFQNERSMVLLRGVDSSAGVPDGYAVPKPMKKVGNHQTYDISGLKDYDYRCLLTVMEARTWKYGTSIMPYRLYLPTNYSPDKKYALAMYLHGSGLNGSDNKLQLGGDVDFHRAFLDYQSTEEFIYVVPQCPVANWNTTDYDITTVVGRPDWVINSATTKPSSETLALWDILLALQKEFYVDSKRIYIAGASAGGQGAYGLMGRYPDLFAGTIIGCAAGDTSLAANYSPIVIAHGALDPAILIERGREMRDVIKAAGGEVKYYEYPDRYHAFTKREEIVEYIQWIFSKRG